MPHHVSDADIIDRVLAGDVDVFETLVERYTPVVWRERYRRREVTVSSLSDETRDWLAGVSSEDGLASGNPPPDPAARFEARELLDWLLSQLSADDRMVLTLTYLEGLSGREAADMLGWSTAKVKVRSHRARAKLSRLAEQAGLNTGGSR